MSRVKLQSGAFVKQKGWSLIFVTTGVSLFALAVFDYFIAKAMEFRSAGPLLVLHDGQGEYLLGKQIDYLEDPARTFDIQQVSSPDMADKFAQGDAEILNFGLRDSAYWLRIKVRNESLSESHWLLDLERPSMNSVFLYAPLPDGNGFVETKTGYVFPFSTRDVKHENFVFNLFIAPGEEQTYYLRVKDMSLDLPLRVWSLQSFQSHDQITRSIIALSFGALFAMLAYNLVLLFIIRDLGYIYYVLFQTSILLFLGCLLGYAPRYLWPNITAWNFFVIPLFVELSAVFQILFTHEFLRFQSRANWLDRTCYILVGLFVIFIPFTLSAGAKILVIILPVVLIAQIYVLFQGVYAMRNGYKPARYYLFSWSIYLLFGFGMIFQHMGWLTIKQFSPDQALQLGVIYLVTFQSLALADRINYYKQENLNTQNRLILQQNETLRLKDELNTTLENARVELEDRVVQRTRELSDLNVKLSAEVAERKRAEDELKRLASVDFLTGLFNRRHFFEIAGREFVKSTRYNHPLSVIIFDIDLFKDVNDTYGHLIGDQALVHIGHLVCEITRKSDVAARYGGEEFIILLPETDYSNAQTFAERLRQLTEESPVPCDGTSIHLTISIGVSAKDDDFQVESLDQLISQADQALYRAKGAGRNRVACHWAK
jgi:two-component system, sensor histidine kinase LadS